MARFPHYKKNVVALGKLLARARLDSRYRRRLMANPTSELRKAGLPENALALMNFEIVDAQDNHTVVLPFRLNQNKFDLRDGPYLTAIARSFGQFN